MSEWEVTENPAQIAYELGSLMGRHEAFGMIANRCSAADAVALLRIREKGLWRSEAQTWNEFCETRLKMSRSNVNRLIQLLVEFGETYFNVANATRISPQTYRAIAPAIRDNALYVDGEAIALTEENAPRIAAAVDALRGAIVANAAEPAGEESGEAVPEDPLEILDHRCADLMAALSDAATVAEGRAGGLSLLRSILALMQSRLARVEEEIIAAQDRSGELLA